MHCGARCATPADKTDWRRRAKRLGAAGRPLTPPQVAELRALATKAAC